MTSDIERAREILKTLMVEALAAARAEGREQGIREAADLARWRGHEPQSSTAILALLDNAKEPK